MKLEYNNFVAREELFSAVRLIIDILQSGEGRATDEITLTLLTRNLVPRTFLIKSEPHSAQTPAISFQK